MRSLRHVADRVLGWWQVTEPVSYRDVVRFSVTYGLIIATYARTQVLLWNDLWVGLTVLIVPAMAAFTAGFAVRSDSPRRTVGSIGVGLLGGGLPFAVPAVRAQVLAAGPIGLLFGWLLVLIGLFGYAFPDYAPSMGRQGTE